MNITNNAHCKGFSLIEIMLAVLILSIGILALKVDLTPTSAQWPPAWYREKPMIYAVLFI